MWKTTLILALSLFIFGCSTPPEKNVTNEGKIGRNNYAITWKWATSDLALVEEHMPAISDELTALWKDDVVENVYYNTGLPEENLEYYPNIAFFLKAHSEQQVKAILNELLVVKKGISTYEIHPVGTLWLDRKAEVINARGMTKSFVTVWTTSTNKPPSDELVKKQNDHVLELWNQGVVENVYFDIPGTQIENQITDFVMFVNAETQVEAEAICFDLPFSREGAATFDMYPSGTFWMGQYEDMNP